LIDKLRRNPRESDDDYLARVLRELPHYPVDVAADWFRTKGTVVLEETTFLDHAQLQFSLARWPTRRLREVTTAKHAVVQAWQSLFAAGDEALVASPLGSFMLRHGTWPVAPTILVGEPRRAGPMVMGSRHLLDGHRRLAYLLAMAQEPSWILLPSHLVWEARVIPGS
jgi:hypothetical protein